VSVQVNVHDNAVSSIMAHVIVVVGLAFEARIASGPGVRVICGGGRASLADELEAALDDDCRGLVSFGLAGGLLPALEPGAAVIATSIVGPKTTWPTNRRWSEALSRAVPHATTGDIAGVPSAVVDVAAKAALYHDTGAFTVDMESHAVAAVAARHGLPLAAVRVVTDPAHRAVPSSALAGMRSDGRTDVLAVIAALMKNPGELPGLLKTAGDAAAARKTLLRSREALGPGFGLPDFR
jgi:hopanoid-associated phosphorylase